jgi:hypothetical protein
MTAISRAVWPGLLVKRSRNRDSAARSSVSLWDFSEFWEVQVRLIRGTAKVLAAGAVAVLCASGPVVAGSPFAALVGTWSGKGTAKLEGGKSERLSCKGYYTGSGGSELRLNIRCANPSTKVELRSVLKYTNGKVTGTWEERNYNQQGTISGRATDSKLQLVIGGAGLKGRLSVSLGDSGQSVSLSTQGSVLKGVSITFARIS